MNSKDLSTLEFSRLLIFYKTILTNVSIKTFTESPWHGCTNGNQISVDGMHEFKLGRVQAQSSKRVARVAVFLITDYGMSNQLHMHTDLIFTSRFNVHV